MTEDEALEEILKLRSQMDDSKKEYEELLTSVRQCEAEYEAEKNLGLDLQEDFLLSQQEEEIEMYKAQVEDLARENEALERTERNLRKLFEEKRDADQKEAIRKEEERKKVEEEQEMKKVEEEKKMQRELEKTF